LQNRLSSAAPSNGSTQLLKVQLLMIPCMFVTHTQCIFPVLLATLLVLK
jgi:hypothetical protein